MARLRSCSYCGKVHDINYNCGKKPVRFKQTNDKDKFRWTKAWQNKRNEIRERDLNLCRVCASQGRYNYTDLEVHHIVSLENDFDKRLDNDNLITLCSTHHEMAEKGAISVKELLNISPCHPHLSL